jgi:hypothetical protein
LSFGTLQLGDESLDAELLPTTLRVGERDLWPGLAQVCVGLTHLQRGNRIGGARLLRRGADRLHGYRGPAFGVEVADVVRQAHGRADEIEARRARAPIQL